MSNAFEHVPEASWDEAKEMLYGTQQGTRILAWVNYDLVSLTRVYYVSEKTEDMIARRIEIDYPVPVFWDDETSLASLRLCRVNLLVDNNCFGEFEHSYPVIQDDTGWESDSVNSVEDDTLSAEVDGGSDDDTESVEAVDGGSDDDTESVEAVDAREYLERQFEQFLYEVEEDNRPQVRETFEGNIDRMVEALRSQR